MLTPIATGQSPFSIRNTSHIRKTPLKRLTLCIAGIGGASAKIVFVRDEQTLDLVAELPAPTEREINESYLLAHDWERVCYDHIRDAWEDSLSGGAYTFENAIALQEGRDLLDGAA